MTHNTFEAYFNIFYSTFFPSNFLLFNKTILSEVQIDTIRRRKERIERKRRLSSPRILLSWKQEHSGGLMPTVSSIPMLGNGTMLLFLSSFSIFFSQERDEEIQRKRKRKEKRNWSVEVTILWIAMFFTMRREKAGIKDDAIGTGRGIAISWLLLQPTVLIPSTHKFIQWELLLNLVGIELSFSCRSIN